MGKMKSAWMAEVGYGYKKEVDSEMESNYPKQHSKTNDPWNLWDNDGEVEPSEQDLGALMAKWEEL